MSSVSNVFSKLFEAVHGPVAPIAASWKLAYLMTVLDNHEMPLLRRMNLAARFHAWGKLSYHHEEGRGTKWNHWGLCCCLEQRCYSSSSTVLLWGRSVPPGRRNKFMKFQPIPSRHLSILSNPRSFSTNLWERKYLQMTFSGTFPASRFVKLKICKWCHGLICWQKP